MSGTAGLLRDLQETLFIMTGDVTMYDIPFYYAETENYCGQIYLHKEQEPR